MLSCCHDASVGGAGLTTNTQALALLLYICQSGRGERDGEIYITVGHLYMGKKLK